MRGDFSRGIQPDEKRGRRYRRVLLQQGRVLLDSDFAATVDALQHAERDALRHVACAHGSSDSGFLCTPGPLLALFDSTEHAVRLSGTPEIVVDYRYRYLERQPSLRVTAEGAAATLRLTLRSAANRIAVWARAEVTTNLTINGVTRALSADSPPAEFERLVFPLAGSVDSLTVALAAGASVWLALIEGDVDAGESPAFYSAQGSYQVDGLTVRLSADSAFPESGFASGAGFWSMGSQPLPPLEGLVADGLAPGDLVVAYLEAWERHVSALEDPGIRERALGGSDTCSRTEALGQVKVARTLGLLPDDVDLVQRVRRAFQRRIDAGGTLTISQQQAQLIDDPCALPELEGYTGADNRLYRFEVHYGGALAEVRLKWSRNNGAELYRAELDSSNQLLVDKDAPLAANDLVEVLSEVIELGDEGLAQITGSGFVPAERAVGTLARLLEVETVASNHRVFELVDPLDTSLPISMAGVVLPRLGELALSQLRLRRWDGIVDPSALAGGGGLSTGPHEVEDGIRLTFSSTGSYEPGQYWQYEARVGGPNANGPPVVAPHGPERLFAPLALFSYAGASEPLELLAWLDERYPRLCSIRADDVGYDGARVESPSQTVQEALDELFDRGPEIIESGCGSLIVRPENSLQAVFDTIPAGADAKVCIHPGSWNLTQSVRVRNKGHLVIEGAGRATRITSNTLDKLLEFDGCASVTLEEVALTGKAAASGESGVLSFVDCQEVSLRALRVQCGSAPTRRLSAIRARVSASGRSLRRVRIADCELEVGHFQTGIRVTDASAVEITGNRLFSAATPLDWANLTQTPEIAAWIGHMLIDDPFVGEPEEIGLNDDWALGDNPTPLGEPSRDGRPRMAAQLTSWGNRFMVFTTHPSLTTEAFWRGLLDANPIRGAGSGNVSRTWVLANLRRLRAGLARWLYQGTGPVVIPSGVVANTLNALRPNLVRVNSVTAGGQGIVVGSQHAPHLLSNQTLPYLSLPPRAPDIRVSDNRIDGFVQGIHLGASYNAHNKFPPYGHPDRGRHLRLYRAHVQRNTVFVRVPPMARERHGIFVGNAMNVQVMENMVELDGVSAGDLTSAPATDGIRVWGSQGPMLLVTGNHTAGVSTGVRVVSLIPGFSAQAGVAWVVRDNAYGGSGTPQVLAL